MAVIPKCMDKLTAIARQKLPDEKLKAVFEKCITNTWETTMKMKEDGTVYIITGDIDAMWLRDSAMQVKPYLHLVGNPEVDQMFKGLVARQMMYIQIDPYANAFNEYDNGNCWEKNDITQHNPWNWERKYEIDSLCFPVYIAYEYYRKSGDPSIFTDACKAGFTKILEVFETEQDHENKSSYRFERHCGIETETLQREGKGRPTGYTGMTWSGFRPSDDACTYGYLVPSNMLAAVILGYIADVAQNIFGEEAMRAKAETLRAQITEGIYQYGVVDHPKFGKVFAYETDGLGNHVIMDDANLPSLLSAPYFGFCDIDDEIYQNTRRMLLSEENPYFFSGSFASGIGSPHTPHAYIWHIALSMQGLTSKTPEEKLAVLRTMAATDAGTNMMHEGFHKDDPAKFTREWFSWANSMFCELALDYCLHQ
ncbi:MAG: glycoside hydrolase family 125 protein [Oscillospiraceae bacterium]